MCIRDRCRDNGLDYNTWRVQDMFGQWHYVKDIRLITTHNAVKWIKFMDLMGDTPADAYRFWCDRVNADGSCFGIVKTDHESKLGEVQQMSYQMLNTLPCTKAVSYTHLDVYKRQHYIRMQAHHPQFPQRCKCRDRFFFFRP